MTTDTTLLLRRLAQRLEDRSQAPFPQSEDEAIDRAFCFTAREMAKELRSLIEAHEREAFLKPLVTATKQAIGAQFDEKRLIKPADLDAIQRIGRDHEENSTTINLDIFDNVIDGYRYLHEQLLGARHKIAALEETLQAERNTRSYRYEPRHIGQDVSYTRVDIAQCPGNCSRGGDGPACGLPGCRG